MKNLPTEAYLYYLTHPIEFAEQQILKLTPKEVDANVLGRRLEMQTKIILSAVSRFDYVSVFSGRGCTKTFSLALLIIWWLCTRQDSRVIATGPKYDNLKATLWTEVRKWLDYSNLSEFLTITGEKIYHTDPGMLAEGHIMTTKDKENISGFHATHVLWVVDEASNVDKAIIDAIIGGMNDPENKIVMTGNPTRTSGPFFDTHNKDREDWKTIRFSSEESERKNPVWFKRMQKYPRESDMYRVNVLGLPPAGNPQAIISLEDCYAARDRIIPAGNYLEMGVDPAREGPDLATIAIRQGMKLLEVRCFPKTKGPVLIGHILKMLREYRSKTGIESKVRIKVDDHGIGGPICDELALNETDNIEAIPCLFGGKGDEQYYDPATIMWFHMADVIESVELCDDEELIEELSTREWQPASGSKLKVEPKSDYKKRTGKSPDRADACILCFHPGPKKIFESSELQSKKGSDFTIDWQYDNLTNPAFDGIFMIDVLHYAALVLNDDLSLNGLAGVYQHFADELWIYAQFHQQHPEPDIISNVVKAATFKGLYDDDRDVRVIGNDKMFRKDLDRYPLSEIILRSGLYIQETETYDEYGAIALGIKMFSEDKVHIHKNLEMARVAINLWTVTKGKPEADNNGFAKALLLILSEVRQRKKEKPKVKTPRDYRPVQKRLQQTKSRNEWCGR